MWLVGKAVHVLYTKKHTQRNASYPAMDISCMLQGARCKSRSRGRALYRDASRVVSCPDPASFKEELGSIEGGGVWAQDYIVGRIHARPASFKGRRSRTRGRSHVSL